MSIGPNGKPIFPSWEQVQPKIQSTFVTVDKLFNAFRDFNQKITPPSIVTQINIGSLGVFKADKKITGLLSSGKGQSK